HLGRGDDVLAKLATDEDVLSAQPEPKGVLTLGGLAAAHRHVAEEVQRVAPAHALERELLNRRTGHLFHRARALVNGWGFARRRRRRRRRRRGGRRRWRCGSA